MLKIEEFIQKFFKNLKRRNNKRRCYAWLLKLLKNTLLKNNQIYGI